MNRQRFNEIVAKASRGPLDDSDTADLIGHVNESLGSLEIPTALPGEQFMGISQEAMRVIIQHYLRQLPFHRGGCPDVIRVEALPSHDSEYPMFKVSFLEPVSAGVFG